MLSVLAIGSHCISVLLADLGESPKSGILLVLKADSELPRFVISFVLDIPPVVLYSYSYLVFR